MASRLALPTTLPPAETFAPLLTESLNGFAVLDSGGRYVYASASLCSLLLLTKDALLGCELARGRAGGTGRGRRCGGRLMPHLRFLALAASHLLCFCRSRAVSELVYPEDRGSIVALLDEARSAAATARPCEAFAQVRHACGAAVAWQPVELKACTDGKYMYCVVLDARVPARLESVLPQFLLSTSAREALEPPPRATEPPPRRRRSRPAHALQQPAGSHGAAPDLAVGGSGWGGVQPAAHHGCLVRRAAALRLKRAHHAPAAASRPAPAAAAAAACV
jgi:hypothetical protein